MKKYLGWMISLGLVTLASCAGPVGPPGPAGEGMNWEVRTYTVRQNDWKLVGRAGELNSYYIYEIMERSLTDFVYTDGNVFAYLIQNPGQKNEVQTPLPYIIPVGEWDKGEEFLWTEIYSFDIMPGSIAFQLRYSDFETGVAPPPELCNFRVVMNW